MRMSPNMQPNSVLIIDALKVTQKRECRLVLYHKEVYSPNMWCLIFQWHLYYRASKWPTRYCTRYFEARLECKQHTLSLGALSQPLHPKRARSSLISHTTAVIPWQLEILALQIVMLDMKTLSSNPFFKMLIYFLAWRDPLHLNQLEHVKAQFSKVVKILWKW